jgi:lipopolysaccharide exporter
MAWTVTLRLLDRSLALISTIILARILVPNDFGIVAMASATLAMMEVFRGLGFEAALIRNKDASDVEFNTAWTLNLILGVATSVALVLLAPVSAEFFREPRVENVLYLLSVVPILEGAVNIGIVGFRKNLDFRSDFKFMALRRVIAVSSTVALAVIWKSYWALPVGTVIGWSTGLVLSYLMHPYRPRLGLQAGRSVIGFSAWIFLNNLLSFLRMRGGSFVIGRLSGPGPLGLFEIAYQIANLPTAALVMPLNRALFPGYVQLRSDMNQFRYGVLQVISAMALVAIPAGVGIAMSSHLIVEAFLGDKWLDAIPIVQMLALFGLSVALQTNVQSVYNSLGKPSFQAMITAGTVALLLPLMILWVRDDGAVGAARAYLVSGLVMLPVNYAICFKLIKLKWRQVGAALWRPVFAAAAMAAVLNWLFPAGNVGMGSPKALASFVGAVGVGAVVYCIAVGLLWYLAGRPEGGESAILRHLGRFLGRYRPNSRH